jgi:hypothetical protein
MSVKEARILWKERIKIDLTNYKDIYWSHIPEPVKELKIGSTFAKDANDIGNCND